MGYDAVHPAQPFAAYDHATDLQLAHAVIALAVVAIALVYIVGPAETLYLIQYTTGMSFGSMSDSSRVSSALSMLGNNWPGSASNSPAPHQASHLAEQGGGERRRPAPQLDIQKVLRNASGPLHYPGLLNAAGNLCFLNATLQSLASLPSLVEFLRGIPQSSMLPSTPVADNLLATLDALNTPSASRPSPLRPVSLATALANSSKDRRRLLNSSEQQDAHELCTMIRQAVAEEIARVDAALDKRSQGSGLGEIVALASLSQTSSASSDLGKKRRTRGPRDPWRLLTSQRIRCMTCGYTRDVRHTEDEQIPLQVPPVAHCSLHDLLQEHTKIDLLSDYACRKCSVTATLDKLQAQRDRLALTQPESKDSPSTSTPSNAFDLPPEPTATPKMTASRKDRKRKTQKLVDRLQAVLDAGDFERELGSDGIKLDKVFGPAGKQTKFARTPDILTIHLSRSVHYGRAGAFKNTCAVSFPERLDMSPFCDYSSPSTAAADDAQDVTRRTASPSGRDTFRLQSLVVHYGSHSFGHYVAFRRAPHAEVPSVPSDLDADGDEQRGLGTTTKRPEWYRISDETVEPASLGEALRANPVLLFYERERERQRAHDGPVLAAGGEAASQYGSGQERDPEDSARWIREYTPRVVERWNVGSESGSTGAVSSSSPSSSISVS